MTLHPACPVLYRSMLGIDNTTGTDSPPEQIIAVVSDACARRSPQSVAAFTTATAQTDRAAAGASAGD